MKRIPVYLLTFSLVLTAALLLIPLNAEAYTSYSASSSSPRVIHFNSTSYGVARSLSTNTSTGSISTPSQPAAPVPVTPPAPPAEYVPPVDPSPVSPVSHGSFGTARSAPSYVFYSSPSAGTQQPSTPAPPSPPPTSSPDDLTALTRQELQLLQLVNNERIKRGLAPLILDPRLTRLARMKSMDMIRNNYFAHHSPTYGSSGDMLRAAGIRFSIAAENIGMGGNINSIFNAFMNSPGHRNKIIGSAYTHTGIGIYYQSGRGYIITQLFMAPR